MEFSGLIHIAIMMVLFIGLAVAIAWVFQGVTEGEENIERRRGAPWAPRKHKVHRYHAHRTVTK